MAPVRSRRLWGPTTIAGLATVSVYTVPGDRVAIVRSQTLSNLAPAAAQYTVRIDPAGAGAAAIVWHGTVPGLGSVSIPYMIVEEGDQITVTNTAGAGQMTSAGFGSLLDGDPE